MANTFNLFFVSDIVGQPGLNLLNTILPGLLDKYDTDFVIANGENSHEGRGINRNIIRNLYDLGVHVITGGNHSFDKWKVFSYWKNDPNLLRPLNYPKGAPGHGYIVYHLEHLDLKIGVLNLQGRTFLPDIDDPFRTADWALGRIKEETDIVIVDFHAEATAEKQAMGWFLDGKVALVLGTHTHVPTNDARILPKGAGYITDAGMTGSFDSVLGMDKDVSQRRFMLGTPQKYKEADGDNRMCGISATIDADSGTCVSIEPVIYPSFENKRSIEAQEEQQKNQ